MANTSAQPAIASILRPQTTLAITRGAARFLRQCGHAIALEMPLSTQRRLDIMALATTGRFLAIEVKSCAEDLRSDRKWHEYRDHCDGFAFAVAPEFPTDLLPPEAGVLLADRFGGEWLREPCAHPLSGARRKALLIAFAQLAAKRLHDSLDPADFHQPASQISGLQRPVPQSSSLT
jgi:hypothetical protein